MKYFIPAMAYARKLGGMDFSTMKTWVAFPAKSEVVHQDLKYQVCDLSSAVIWRINHPPNLRVKQTVFGVLEVVFLAVWKERRDRKYGTMMVNQLKKAGREAKCKYMFVEIGDETYSAERFWRSHGFLPLSEFKEMPCEQVVFFNHNCLRFYDTVAFISYLDIDEVD